MRYWTTMTAVLVAVRLFPLLIGRGRATTEVGGVYFAVKSGFKLIDASVIGICLGMVGYPFWTGSSVLSWSISLIGLTLAIIFLKVLPKDILIAKGFISSGLRWDQRTISWEDVADVLIDRNGDEVLVQSVSGKSIKHTEMHADRELFLSMVQERSGKKALKAGYIEA